MHYTSRYVTVRGDRIRSKVFFSDWKFEKYPHKFQINVWLVVVDMSQRSKCKLGSLDTSLLQVESDAIYVRNLVRGDLRRRADSLSPLFYVSSLPGFNFSRTSSIFRFQLHGEWGFLLKAMRAKKIGEERLQAQINVSSRFCMVRSPARTVWFSLGWLSPFCLVCLIIECSSRSVDVIYGAVNICYHFWVSYACHWL